MEIELVPAAPSNPARCALCRDVLQEPTVGCGACATRVHSECAKELSRCPTLGCRGDWRAATAPTGPDPTAPTPPTARPSAPTSSRERSGGGRRRLLLLLLLLVAPLLAAWVTTLDRPEGAERVLGGWFTGHGSTLGAVVATFGAEAPPALGGVSVDGVAFVADRLLTAGRGELLEWDLETGVVLRRAALDSATTEPRLCADPERRRLLLAGSQTGEVWDLTTLARTRTVFGPIGSRVVAAASSSAGPRFAAAALGEVALLDDAGVVVARLATARATVRQVAFSADGAWLAAHSSADFDEGVAQVWDLRGAAPALRATLRTDEPGAPLALSRTGRLLAWHDTVKGTHVHDLDGGTSFTIPQSGIGYGARVALAFSPDDTHLAAVSWQGLDVYPLASRRGKRLPGHGGRRVPVTAVAWGADGGRVVTGGADQRAIVWTVLTAER